MKQWTYRTFEKLLKDNGFERVRSKGGHVIFQNNENNHVSISRKKVESAIARRLIKENNLKEKYENFIRCK